MIKLSAEVVENRMFEGASGFICRVELREYGRNNKRVVSTTAVAKPTTREAWADCAQWVQGFMSKKKSSLAGSRRRR